MPDPAQTPATRPRSRRRRAVILDALTLLASTPLAYVRAWFDTREIPSFDQFANEIKWTLPLTFLFVLARRFAHARRRGRNDEYDYIAMNPRGKFEAVDFLSAVPYMDWERHRGQKAFFDNVIDRARFIDTPGLALDLRCRQTVDGVLETLAPFRAAALHWDAAHVEGGCNVHAIFDIPPASANQWTSDHGARMWLRAAPSDEPGSCNVRIVFGPGGFGQGQPAAVIAALVPSDWFPIEAVSWSLRVEAELRGAVSWWILVGRALGVDDREFTNLDNVRLAAGVVTGTARSVANRETGKVILWTVLGGILLLFGVPLIIALLG